MASSSQQIELPTLGNHQDHPFFFSAFFPPSELSWPLPLASETMKKQLKNRNLHGKR